MKESLLKAFFHQTRLKPARKPELMMLEKIVNVNDVDIAYQLHGNNQNPTIMLIVRVIFAFWYLTPITDGMEIMVTCHRWS